MAVFLNSVQKYLVNSPSKRSISFQLTLIKLPTLLHSSKLHVNNKKTLILEKVHFINWKVAYRKMVVRSVTSINFSRILKWEFEGRFVLKVKRFAAGLPQMKEKHLSEGSYYN
mmetsp:Transcript_11233/g.8256  ORF Transcript_11233/g.8256 Transcript_11233/m.8256 type:complete len:113 (-) Transcript_11233:4-342(-)